MMKLSKILRKTNADVIGWGWKQWSCLILIGIFLLSMVVYSATASDIKVDIKNSNGTLTVNVGNTTSTYDSSTDFVASLDTDVECVTDENVSCQVIPWNDEVRSDIGVIVKNRVDQANADEQIWFTNTVMPQTSKTDGLKTQRDGWKQKYETDYTILEERCNDLNNTCIAREKEYESDIGNMTIGMVILVSILIGFFIVSMTGSEFWESIKQRFKK